MRDVCYGGIGNEIATFETTVNKSVTAEAIRREARKLAYLRREAELQAQEKAIIDRYAAEIVAETA